jgi:hypothetical protein
VEGVELGGVREAAGVPGEEGRDGPAAEDGDHVADAVGVLRVLVEHVEEARVAARVEDAAPRVVGQHALMPEHRQLVSRWINRRRPLPLLLRRRRRGGPGVHLARSVRVAAALGQRHTWKDGIQWAREESPWA